MCSPKGTEARHSLPVQLEVWRWGSWPEAVDLGIEFRMGYPATALATYQAEWIRYICVKGHTVEY